MASSVRSDLLAKVSGTARYAQDLIRPGTALAGVVRSPVPSARISSIDVHAALAIDGVLGHLSGDDFKGFRLGGLIEDQPVLADGVVRHVGEPVVAIAAETPDALRRALAAVRVVYEPLPTVLDVDAALASSHPIHEASPGNVADAFSAEHGVWEAAVAQVRLWVDGEFDVPAVQHAYMEPYAGLARLEADRVVLHVPVHSPHQIRDQYARWTERWGGAELEIVTPVIGGSFGAKYEHPLHLIVAEFAHRLRRDVGFVLSRREDFMQASPRVGMHMSVRIGASADGRLLAKETDILADNGAYSLDAPLVYGAAAVRIDNLYRFEAVRARGKLVYTNRLPTQCFRGFGSPQSAFAQEQLVDEVARRLGLAPFEIRRRNAVRDGDTTVHGWRIGACGLTEAIDLLEGAVTHDLPMSQIGGGRYRTGLGVAAGTHVIGNRSASGEAQDGTRIRLRIRMDGRVEAFSPEVEVGAGTIGLFTSLVADGLGVPVGDVEVNGGDTTRAPFGLGSFASRTTFFAGNAILDGVVRLFERVAEVRERLGLGPTESLSAIAEAAARAGCLDDLDVIGEYVVDGVERHDESWFGNVSPSYTFGAHACEVRVDTWTGRVEVLRYWAVHDAGAVLDEPAARGQVLGGVLQGLGYALSEEVVVNHRLAVLNPGFLDYRIPTFADRIPIDVRFTQTRDRSGPLGAKSIAEPPIIPVAACVANAVRDATGTRVRRLPLRPETVHGACNGP